MSADDPHLPKHVGLGRICNSNVFRRWSYRERSLLTSRFFETGPRNAKEEIERVKHDDGDLRLPAPNNPAGSAFALDGGLSFHQKGSLGLEGMRDAQECRLIEVPTDKHHSDGEIPG